MEGKTIGRIIGLALCSLVIYFLIIRPRQLPEKVEALEPVIAELMNIKKQTGVFPADPASIASIEELGIEYRIYFGEVNEDKVVEWSPHKVSAHDFTVLVHSQGVAIFAPTGRIKPWSFSSFRVWRWTSYDSKWERGKIHWSLMGVYWSKN